MRKTTLVIMAAGLGSRFGEGIKQLSECDDYGHIIMDYSVHDAIESGFNKIIFIIRKDIEKEFQEIIGKRIEAVCKLHDIEVKYCIQNIHDIPGEFPEGRTKPWGTGQAVLSAYSEINSSFAVINADDYYGKEAFRRMHEWLVGDHDDHAIAMVGFVLKNTLSENGGVTRGICCMNDGHTHITDVIETKNIIKTEKGPMANGVEIDLESYVSMNMWGFPAKKGIPHFMNVLQIEFEKFCRNSIGADPLEVEFLLPEIIGGLLRRELCTVKVLPSADRWFGVTYIEDKEVVKENFNGLIKEKIYQEDLYCDLL